MMTSVDAATGLSAEDRAALKEAVHALEHPGFAARLASVIGQPVERVGRALPPAAAEAIAAVTAAGGGKDAPCLGILLFLGVS